jgi:hypothetical protein
MKYHNSSKFCILRISAVQLFCCYFPTFIFFPSHFSTFFCLSQSLHFFAFLFFCKFSVFSQSVRLFTFHVARCRLNVARWISVMFLWSYLVAHHLVRLEFETTRFCHKLQRSRSRERWTSVGPSLSDSVRIVREWKDDRPYRHLIGWLSLSWNSDRTGDSLGESLWPGLNVSSLDRCSKWCQLGIFGWVIDQSIVSDEFPLFSRYSMLDLLSSM